MDSYSNQFVREHHDFVLKLNIKSAEGSNQIRRVRLPRLLDAAGKISYDELVGLTIAFTFPEGSPQNYTVSLTYFDVDEDTVTIASTEELIDAIEQFAEKKLLRLTTDVKPKETPTPLSAPETAAYEPSTIDDTNVTPQIKGALDTFAGILSMAVNHLQEGLAAPGTQSRETTVTVTPEWEESTPSVPQAAAPVPSPDCEESPAAAPESPNVEPEFHEGKPFIHGRHTCDSCLVTPIIGKRYHATNLPDYDLCENCYVNYSGQEVKFEPAELERDRPFQARWHRRREKIERFQQRRSVTYERMSRRHDRGPPGFFAHHGAGQFGNRWEGCHAGRAPQCHPGRPGPIPTSRPPFATPHEPPRNDCTSPNVQTSSSSNDRHTDFDEALKEAIRRSLRDIAPREAELMEEPKPAATEHVVSFSKEVEHMVESEPAATEDVVSSPKEAELMEESKPAAIEDVVSSPKEAELMEESKPAAIENVVSSPKEAELMEESKPAAIEDTVSAQKEAEHVEESKPEVDVQNSRDSYSLKMEDSVSNSEPVVESQYAHESDIYVEPDYVDECGFDSEEAKAMEEAMETESVDSEKLMTEDDQKPAAVEHASDRNLLDVSREDSFQSEAVGNGEIAEAVGATLDLVAGMISDMLSEAGSPLKKTTTQADNLKPAPKEAEPGALIVEPVESVTIRAVTADEGEWQVVGCDDEVDFMQHDEDIARAAEMLGSALFQSSTKGSDEIGFHENLSNLSDSFSVPSIVPSLSVGDAQRSRWSAQLMKLKELGFEDDAQCIEILERLQAANIGVDSQDDVSVTQVVNALLE